MNIPITDVIAGLTRFVQNGMLGGPELAEISTPDLPLAQVRRMVRDRWREITTAERVVPARDMLRRSFRHLCRHYDRRQALEYMVLWAAWQGRIKALPPLLNDDEPVPAEAAAILREDFRTESLIFAGDPWGDLMQEEGLMDSAGRGQVMTPESVAGFLAEMLTDQIEIQPGHQPRMLDPACGTGRLLLGINERMGAHARYYGAEIDPTLYRISLVNADANLMYPSAFLCCNSLQTDLSPGGPNWQHMNTWNPPPPGTLLSPMQVARGLGGQRQILPLVPAGPIRLADDD